MLQLRPDRIALYAYAHLPERFKPQRRISIAELPDATAKLTMLSRSITAFLNAGYVYVGMDHFALPNDELAIAKRQGRGLQSLYPQFKSGWRLQIKKLSKIQ